MKEYRIVKRFDTGAAVEDMNKFGQEGFEFRDFQFVNGYYLVIMEKDDGLNPNADSHEAFPEPVKRRKPTPHIAIGI